MNFSNRTKDICDIYGGESICASCKSSLKTEWMTTNEAANFLGWSVGTLRNKTSDGKVPYVKLGRLNRYNKAELQNLLLSNRRGLNNGYY